MKYLLYWSYLTFYLPLRKKEPHQLGLGLLVFLCFFAFYSAGESQTTDKNTKSLTKPLILQRVVSHPRNTDQISLIFRENKVEMVTNTSTWQKSNHPRLGRFESALTPSLKSLKQRLNRYHGRLKRTVPLSSLVKDSRLEPSHTPHAPIFRLNTKEIKEGEVFFKELEDIIQQTGTIKWVCVECAEYQRHKKGILRIVRKQTKRTKKVLSKKSLNCIHKPKSRWECVDKLFGIFEIKSL